MYKTEKRFAKVGEQILITNAEAPQGHYENGDVLKVSHTEGVHPDDPNPAVPFVLDDNYGEVFCEGIDSKIFIAAAEYEVVIGEETEQ